MKDGRIEACVDRIERLTRHMEECRKRERRVFFQMRWGYIAEILNYPEAVFGEVSPKGEIGLYCMLCWGRYLLGKRHE